jgi:hypothetical protein
VLPVINMCAIVVDSFLDSFDGHEQLSEPFEQLQAGLNRAEFHEAARVSEVLVENCQVAQGA